MPSLSLYKPHKRARIGQTKVYTWDDPKAPGSALEEMVLRHEYRALLNPNFPLDKLINYAKALPYYVDRNPALELYELEDPKGYADLREKLQEGYLETVFPKLSEMDQVRVGVALLGRYIDDYEEIAEASIFREYLQGLLSYTEGKLSFDDQERLMDALQKQEQLLQRARREAKGTRHALLMAALELSLSAKCFTPELKAERAFNYLFGAVLFLNGGAVDPGGYGAADEQPQEALLAQRKEQTFAAKIIRQAYQQQQRSGYYLAILSQLEENKRRRGETQKAIDAAVKKAKEGARLCAEIMAKKDPHTWPIWVGLGLVGGVAVLLLGPELLAAGSVAAVVGEVTAVSESVSIGVVSVQSFIEGTAITEAAETQAFFNAMVKALQKEGLEVVTEAAEVVAKVAH